MEPAITVSTTANKPEVIENYDSFMQRMELFFLHSDCVTISIFYKLIKYEFRAKFRRDEKDENDELIRYFEHLRRVTLILLDEVGIVNLTAILVALGHDAVEDTRMTLEEITRVCGIEVSKRIALCSKVPKQGFEKRLQLHADWITLAVKVADRIDNLRSLGPDQAFRQKQCDETRYMYLPLADLMIQRSAGSDCMEKVEQLRRLLIVSLQNAQQQLHAL